jgi:hypothetical protein
MHGRPAPSQSTRHLRRRHPAAGEGDNLKYVVHQRIAVNQGEAPLVWARYCYRVESQQEKDSDGK